MDITTIEAEYKRRHKELTDKLGRRPNTHDVEYWDLANWYNAQATALKDNRSKPQALEDDAARKKVERDKARPLLPEIKCRRCGRVVPRVAKRGRPYTTCQPTCPDSPDP